MADHLAYLRIYGLQGDAAECFESISAGSAGSSGTSSAAATGTDMTSFFESVADSFSGIWEWITGQVPAEETTEESTARGTRRARFLPAVVTAGLPALFAALPPAMIGAGAIALATSSVSQLTEAFFDDYIDTSSERHKLQDIEDRLTELVELFRTAFIYEDGILQLDQSILYKALLEENDENDELKSYLEYLKDLRYNDEVLDFGAFRAHLKGKIIQY